MNESYEHLIRIIKQRRSIFPASYLSKEIPEELLLQVLESANYAPTHKLSQPWRFTVLTGAAKTRLGEELGRIYKETIPEERFMQKKYDGFAVKTSQAAAIIAIGVQFHPDKLPEWEELASVACAVQNMALTAESLSLGGYWSSPPLIAHLGDFLDLGSDEKCYGLFYLGYHQEESRSANRTPMTEKIRWMKE